MATDTDIARAAPIVDYLDAEDDDFVEEFITVTMGAIKRRLKTSPRSVGIFFNDDEKMLLMSRLSRLLTVSDLIGRAQIQLEADRELQRDYEAFAEGIFPWTAAELSALFTPRAALAFFRRIAGIVVEGGVEFYEMVMQGRAFSLAVTADQVIRDKVAKVIDNRIETGKDIRGAYHVVEEILDETGIAHRNGYGEMVVRTNMLESYRSGAWSRFSADDLAHVYPVWMYTGIEDGRQRQGPEPEKPNHKIHCKKYWPRSVNFFDVRGRTGRDTYNCRCNFIGVTRRQWAKLEAAGARLEVAPVPSW